MSFTTDFSIALLDVPTHWHGKREDGKPSGAAFISYGDAVRVAHEVHKKFENNEDEKETE